MREARNSCASMWISIEAVTLEQLRYQPGGFKMPRSRYIVSAAANEDYSWLL